jgi:transposase-like protein
MMTQRRTFTAEFKTQVVLDFVSGAHSAAELCRQHQLNPQLLSRWKTEFLERASLVFEQDQQRSSYYHRPLPRQERGLQQAIEEVAASWPRYGYRRVTQQLRREGWTVNHKPVERIMRELGLQAHRKAKRRTDHYG